MKKLFAVVALVLYALALLIVSAPSHAAKWEALAGSGQNAFGEKQLQGELRLNVPLLELADSELSASGRLSGEVSAAVDDLTPELFAGLRLQRGAVGVEFLQGQDKPLVQTDFQFSLLPHVRQRAGLRHKDKLLYGFVGGDFDFGAGWALSAEYSAGGDGSGQWLFGVGYE